MPDAWFDEEVQALQEICARLHQDLNTLRERIDRLEAIQLVFPPLSTPTLLRT